MWSVFVLEPPPSIVKLVAGTSKPSPRCERKRYDTKWNFYFIYILLLMKLTNVRLSHLKFMRTFPFRGYVYACVLVECKNMLTFHSFSRSFRSLDLYIHSEQFTMRRMNIHIWRETAHMLKQLVTALENAGKKIVAATTSKKKLAPTRTQTLKCIIKHHQWQILIIVYKTQQHLQWPISSKHVDRNRTENWDE